jgi:hypothetical protein
LTDVDSQADTVAGTAAPGSLLDNVACDENGCVYRFQVNTGDDQQWLADFSVPTEDRFDIRPGSEGNVQQSDEDGDATSINWKVPFDSDGDGLNDDVDACPYDNPNGYDADHNGCTDTATDLRPYLANLPANVIPGNIKASLLANVDSAIKLLNRGKEQGAIGQLNDFINLVKAQRGKKIAAATADLLIAYARNIVAGIP